jgi:hypothetical protein
MTIVDFIEAVAKKLKELGYNVTCDFQKEPRLLNTVYVGEYFIRIDVKTKELIQPEIIYTFRYSSHSLEEIKKQVGEWLKETFNIRGEDLSCRAK